MMNMLMQHVFKRAKERSSGRLYDQNSRRKSSLHGSWKFTSQSASVDFTEDFLIAVKDNDLQSVENLIYEIDDDAKTSEIGLRALQVAVKEGHCDMVEFLLTHCAISDDLFNPDVDQHNPLLITACQHGHIDVARLLVSYGTNVNATNSHGITALIAAARANISELIYFLCDNGAAVDQETESEPIPMNIRWFLDSPTINDEKVMEICSYYVNNTALTYACTSGKVTAVKVLLDKGADVNRRNSYANTPLHIAIKPRPIVSEALEELRPALVKELLLRGALVTTVNVSGFNPLDQLLSEIFAIRNSQNSVECMKNIFDTMSLLLRAGAYPDRFLTDEKTSASQNLYSMLNNLYSTGQDRDWEKRARKSYITCISILVMTRKQISYDDIAIITKNVSTGKDLSNLTTSLMQIVQCGFSLKQQCRLVIHELLRAPSIVTVNSLEEHIPKALVKYVAFTKSSIFK